jgi:hypothetical protein
MVPDDSLIAINTLSNNDLIDIRKTVTTKIVTTSGPACFIPKEEKKWLRRIPDSIAKPDTNKMPVARSWDLFSDFPMNRTKVRLIPPFEKAVATPKAPIREVA